MTEDRTVRIAKDKSFEKRVISRTAKEKVVRQFKLGQSSR